MGCACGKTGRPTVLEVTFNHTTSLFPTSLGGSELRKQINNRFPQLQYKSWYLADQRTGAQLRTPSQHQSYLSGLRGRDMGKLIVHVDSPVTVNDTSPLRSVLPAICAIWSQSALLCNGFYIGNGLVVVPEGVVKTWKDLQAVFRPEVEEIVYPLQPADKQYILKDCHFSLIRLDVSPPPSFLSKLTPVSFLHPGPKPNSPLICYCHSTHMPVLRAVSGACVLAPTDRFTLTTTMPDGCVGSPVFAGDGTLVGLVVEGSSCIPIRKLVTELKTYSGTPDIEGLLSGNHHGERSRESIDINGISLEEDKSLPAITILESPVNALHKTRQQSAQPAHEFQFDEDLEQAPVSPRSNGQEPRAFLMCSLKTGSELWRLNTSDHAIIKETSTVDIPKGCSFQATALGIIVTGGDDPMGRKVYLWTNSGLKLLSELRFSHSKHASVLVGRYLYIVSGQTTDTVETFNCASSSVETYEPLPKQRYCAGICAMQHSAIYLAGGYVGPQGKPSRSVLECKIRKGEWNKLGLKLDFPVTSPGLAYLPPMGLLIMGGRSALGHPTSEAFILDLQSCMRTSALFLPEPATFSYCAPVKDEAHLVTFTDMRQCFEYDIQRQRFYLLSI